MWPFVLLGGAAVALIAFVAGKKKATAARAVTAPAAASHHDHVSSMRDAVRAAPGPTPSGTATPRDVALLAAYLRKYQHQYDPSVVRDFQSKTGLTQDGIYGSNTRAMLIRLGATNAPPALGTSSRAFGRG